MKKIISWMLMGLLASCNPAMAQSTILPGYLSSPGVTVPASTTNPLPVSVYTNATSGYCLTSNGSGAATFQACGSSGAGVSLGTSVTSTNPHISSDTTSGFYTPAGSTVGVVTNGTEVMRWTPIGSSIITSTAVNALAVGISGITNPALNIDTSTAGGVTGLSFKALTTGGNSILQFTDSAANSNGELTVKGTGNLYVGPAGSGGVNLWTNGSTRVAVTNATTVISNAAEFTSTATVGTTALVATTALTVSGSINQSTEKSCSTGLTTDSNGTINGCVASDPSQKSGIYPLAYDPSILDKLYPIIYRWKDASKYDDKEHFGFNARQVFSVAPQLTKSAGNGLLGIDNSAMDAVIILKIKDMQNQINEIKMTHRCFFFFQCRGK